MLADIRKSPQHEGLSMHIEELELSAVKAERDALYASQELLCPHCKKKHAVGKLMLLTGMRYHESYSSYEDSSWDPDKSHYVICPSCVGVLGFTDEQWVAEFKEHFQRCEQGSLQYRKGTDDWHKDRTGKVSLMVTDRDSYGYTELLIPHEAIAKAVDGKIADMWRYRS